MGEAVTKWVATAGCCNRPWRTRFSGVSRPRGFPAVAVAARRGERRRR